MIDLRQKPQDTLSDHVQDLENLPPDDLIDISTAAKLARCNNEAVYRWCWKGRLRGWRRVGRLFVSKAAVLALFKPIRTRVDAKAEAAARRESKRTERREERENARANREAMEELRRLGMAV